MGGGWIRSVRLERESVASFDQYPFNIPAVAELDELKLHPAVTFLVGENGSGKSTLLEAIAVAAGFNPEGGSQNLAFETRDSTSVLHEHLRLIREPFRPSTGFFLRAESFFNVATQVDDLGPGIMAAYGGRSLHEQSHGESFLALALNRFGPDGLYVMDEPEAALSPQGCLALIRRIHELAAANCQFVIATHSPLLVAYPDAHVYELDTDGLALRSYHDTRNFQLFRRFTEAPERFLRHLLED